VLREDFRSYSDVEVLVEFFPGHIPGLLKIAEMERELSSLLGRKVDLLTREAISPYIRERIQDDLQVLYEAG